MATKTKDPSEVEDRRGLLGEVEYTPGKTLGRSGYIDDDVDALGDRLRWLDALLCVVTNEDRREDGSLFGFFSLNNEIQLETLRLASHLATEAHELREKLMIESLNRRFQ
jgi:hypothetical protein